MKNFHFKDFLTRHLHQSWVVVFLCIGIIGGVILGLIFRINYFANPLFLMLSGFLTIICLIRPLYSFMILAILSGFLLSFVRVAGELKGENYIRNFYGSNITVTGNISGDPQTDESGTKYKLTNLRFGESCNSSTGEPAGNPTENTCQSSAGSLYISGYKNYKLSRGDTVTLTGKISEGFGTYAGYMYRPEIQHHLVPEPRDFILTIRNWFASRIEQLIPEPEVKLGLSYLLGMKTGLSDDLSEQLRIVGLTHIVVASGAHLSILVEVAKKLFGKVSRFAGLAGATLFILFFMAMVGWTPSIMRAGIMAILTLISWYVGRKISPYRIILMVAAVTLLINPMFIIDLGWLLSFASYAGIMILDPKIQRFFYGTKKPGFIGSTVLTTIAATLMTLPIVLYYYGQISLISVLANLLILPTLPAAMGLVFLTGIVSGIPGIEIAISWCATKLLDFHIAVVGFFGAQTQFLVKIEPYLPQVFLIYLLILAIIIPKKLTRKSKM